MMMMMMIMIIITLFQEGKTLRHYFQATKSYKSVFFNNVALSLSLSLSLSLLDVELIMNMVKRYM